MRLTLATPCLANLLEEVFEDGGWRVVCVDQYGEVNLLANAVGLGSHEVVPGWGVVDLNVNVSDGAPVIGNVPFGRSALGSSRKPSRVVPGAGYCGITPKPRAISVASSGISSRASSSMRMISFTQRVVVGLIVGIWPAFSAGRHLRKVTVG